MEIVKLKSNNDFSSISINGKEYIIKDGIVEIEKNLIAQIDYLGFEIITETHEKTQENDLIVTNTEETKTIKKTKNKRG